MLTIHTFSYAQAQVPPGGVPLFSGNPLAAFSFEGETDDDGAAELVPVNGQPFSEALRVRVQRKPSNPGRIRLKLGDSTVAPVATGDVLLATFSVRGSVGSPVEISEPVIRFVLEQAVSPEEVLINFTASVGDDWTQVHIPFVAQADNAAGELAAQFVLGFGPQTVEIGGLSVLNYGGEVAVDDLPVTRFTYEGRDADAPWRKAAQARIENIRKGDLEVVVTDAEGNAVSGATVNVNMTRHAFGFGTAVDAEWLLDRSTDGRRYRETVRRRFNKVVFENDLKWDNWEDAARRAQETLPALRWLERNGLEVRGHVLVWPSWNQLPEDLFELRDNPAALRRRVSRHIQSEVGALRGRLTEWDVINEPYVHHELTDVLGEEAVLEWFRLARQADADVRLFINEIDILSSGESDVRTQAHYENLIGDLLESGAPLGGIGMQGHFLGRNPEPTSPERLLDLLDRFGRFDLPIQVHEFDIDTTDEPLQADYTRDFYTALFSHPAVTGIVMWGFWEGRHWRPDAALWRDDWTLKPNGRAWMDLVHRAWWTDAQGHTGEQGRYQTRGFLGNYQITVTFEGQTRRTHTTLSAGGKTVHVVFR